MTDAATTPNEFALEDRVTELERKDEGDSYIAIEQFYGMDELNGVQAYGPFATKEDADKFVSRFKYRRATLGIVVTLLAGTQED